MLRIIIISFLMSCCFFRASLAQVDTPTEERLSQVEAQLAEQEQSLVDLKEEGAIALVFLFLFGFVLSMWAMNRERSGCLWSGYSRNVKATSI